MTHDCYRLNQELSVASRPDQCTMILLTEGRSTWSILECIERIEPASHVVNNVPAMGHTPPKPSGSEEPSAAALQGQNTSVPPYNGAGYTVLKSPSQ